ncbi:MAG: hypothetical protein KKG04_06745 [Candidatus Thermoplasmatota archaeon]|nr:hypothetical protein [Candidatus Thermoplasmatota archaeon]
MNQHIILKSIKNTLTPSFIYVIKNCYIDMLSGQFHCNKCHPQVYINWAEHTIYCSNDGLL